MLVSLKKYFIVIVVAACFSLQAHILFSIFFYNQRSLISSPLYCNALFAQEFTQGGRELLSITLEKNLMEQEIGEGNTLESDDPAGKFNSSFHVGGQHKELVKRLRDSLDLKPKKNINNKKGSGRSQGGKKGKEKGKGRGYPKVFEDILPGNQAKQSYIHRKREYQDIVVKEVLPTLYTIDKPFESILKQAPKDLKKHNDRDQVIEDFRSWLDGIDPNKMSKVEILRDTEGKGHLPLHFPKSARRNYFDKTLKRSKELQLKQFIDKYFHYDPNKGDLPMAIRDLYYQNIQRLAYMFSSDITFFMIDYFQENLNKEDFLRHSLSKASELKNTKAATELLFAIENIYEIQQRAIRLLFDFNKRYKHIRPERKNRLRNETLKRMMIRYLPLLTEKNILNNIDSFKIYAKKRLEIMDYLIKETPNSYRVKDALFEKGRIYWELGKVTLDASQYEKAIQTWSKVSMIKSDRGDFVNAKAFKQIWPYLKAAAVRRPEQKGRLSVLPLVGTVSQILDSRLQRQLANKRLREDRLLWP